MFSRLVLFNKGGGSGSNPSLTCLVKMTPAISNLGWPVPAEVLGAQEVMGASGLAAEWPARREARLTVEQAEGHGAGGGGGGGLLSAV